jgi:hypothetical protein
MRALVVALVLAAASVAHAQDAERVAAPTPAPSEPSVAVMTVHLADAEDEARALRLHDVRLSHRAGRETEGFGLMIYGLASIVFGGVVAAVGYQDERVLGFGLGTVLWGALNAAFSPIFFDLDGGTRRRIDADLSLRGEALDHAREDWAADQYRNAAGISVNVGLDVFYAVTGALLSVIGWLITPEQRWLEGYGVAMGAQGLGLLAFDLTTWMTAEARGEETRRLFRDPEPEATP